MSDEALGHLFKLGVGGSLLADPGIGTAVTICVHSNDGVRVAERSFSRDEFGEVDLWIAGIEQQHELMVLADPERVDLDAAWDYVAAKWGITA